MSKSDTDCSAGYCFSFACSTNSIKCFTLWPRNSNTYCFITGTSLLVQCSLRRNFAGDEQFIYNTFDQQYNYVLCRSRQHLPQCNAYCRAGNNNSIAKSSLCIRCIALRNGNCYFNSNIYRNDLLVFRCKWRHIACNSKFIYNTIDQLDNNLLC